MNNVLIIVDMQYDFISGALGSTQAQKIVDRVASLQNKFNTVIFTQDTHPQNYEETNEYKIVPIRHCIVNTDGWKIHSAFNTNNHKIIRKDSFGSDDLVKYLKTIKNISSITLVGLCTDICVIENAKKIKKAFANIPIIVLKDYCAGSSKQKHNKALKQMQELEINIKGE